MATYNFYMVREKARGAAESDTVHEVIESACFALERSSKEELSIDMVNEGVLMITEASSLGGAPINDILQLWKMYLHFLKQHGDKICEDNCELLVATISACISQGVNDSFLDSIVNDTDTVMLTKKVQLLLFFCQRLFTSIVYLSSKLSDTTIQSSYLLLHLCRGVSFDLGHKFCDHSILTSKASKFDALFVSCLDNQSNQLCSEEVMRRKLLYHKTVNCACFSPEKGLRHKFVLLGVLSFSGTVLLNEKFTGEYASDRLSPNEGNASNNIEKNNDITDKLLVYITNVVLAASCLNTFYCGELSDKVRNVLLLLP